MLSSTARLFTVVAFAAIMVQAASVNLTELLKRDSFANFFDDENCSVNGGIGVSIDNDGCLGERGRKSVYIPNNGFGSSPINAYCLVKTRDSDACNCQNEGYNFTPTGFCAVLDPSFGSYRFINEACSANNC
ncbi:hypothetical protein BKA62DRAFT_697295 [Auriculariales sp. MPI-PUGE-AT-0066]|nr:hypothetical protein BKA62DRAFT_697295 [Auriculariales sp. MPI-PUGE-AT-0066]